MRAHEARRAKRRRSRAGYTLVEVMMALAVLMVGAVAILGMHRAVMRGNSEARQIATATTIVSTWIERIQRDAIGWSQGGPTLASTFVPATHLASTRYLNLVPAPTATPTWFVPGSTGELAMFDHFGQQTSVAADARYCTNVRLQWVYFAQAIRADVRVWWPRVTPSAQTQALWGCQAGDLEALGSNTRDVGFVYASTIVRWTPTAGGGS